MTSARSRSSKVPAIGLAVNPETLIRGTYESVSAVKGFASLLSGLNHLLGHPLEGLHEEGDNEDTLCQANTTLPFIYRRLTAH
jgi:hypothetical protein